MIYCFELGSLANNENYSETVYQCTPHQPLNRISRFFEVTCIQDLNVLILHICKKMWFFPHYQSLNKFKYYWYILLFCIALFKKRQGDAQNHGLPNIKFKQDFQIFYILVLYEKMNVWKITEFHQYKSNHKEKNRTKN